jgi:hypothetical protein
MNMKIRVLGLAQNRQHKRRVTEAAVVAKPHFCGPANVHASAIGTDKRIVNVRTQIYSRFPGNGPETDLISFMGKSESWFPFEGIAKTRFPVQQQSTTALCREEKVEGLGVTVLFKCID